MSEFAVYRVIGRREYRGHEPGTEFHARLDPAAEWRAIRRGDIELLERLEPAIAAGSFKLPGDWLREESETVAASHNGKGFNR